MKKIILILLFIGTFIIGFSQNQTRIDSLKNQLDHEQQDTNRVLIMLKLEQAFTNNTKPDSAKATAEKALDLATKINYPKGKYEALIKLMNYHRPRGNSPISLSYGHKAMQIAKEMNDHPKIGEILDRFAMLYMLNLRDYQKAKNYLKQSIQEFETLRDRDRVANLEIKLSSLYRRVLQFDSMLFYQQKAYSKYEKLNKLDSSGLLLMILGANHAEMGNYALALQLLQKGTVVNHKIKDYYQEVNCLQSIAAVYKKMNRLDSSIYYEKKAIEVATPYDYKQLLIISYKNLADIYEAIDKDTAHQYQKMAWDINETVNGTQKIIDLEKTIVEEQERQQKEDIERINRENRLKQYSLLAGLGIMFLIGFMLYRNNRQKHKANIDLQEQKNKVDNTLSQLKSTQAQLIQSEKLASLGELTAGIAHEIQNPLNFVNNFSELFVDLANELEDEIKKPELDKDLIADLTNDIKSNQEKISHHGKRASSIVKGMLEHSKASTGVKEMTDINKLADEYLRLAYHGLRAKDKDFNADIKTEFDESLPKIEVIPQDMGRVLLNLINNAFWAVNHRTQLSKGFKHLESSDAYIPSVLVTTKQLENAIEIRVKDNGTGMPESVRTKIFQPFFTTKPTGQGTGLGLSLAYDIVTKGHGGALEVLSTEGVGSEFIITLPFKND
jgi:two-component system, NtrC family, sensor kinase